MRSDARQGLRHAIPPLGKGFIQKCFAPGVARCKRVAPEQQQEDPHPVQRVGVIQNGRRHVTEERGKLDHNEAFGSRGDPRRIRPPESAGTGPLRIALAG